MLWCWMEMQDLGSSWFHPGQLKWQTTAKEGEWLVVMDKEHSAPANSEERINRVPRWLVGTAILALTVVASGIVYGYLARPKPDWIGVAHKNVWDWLDLLVVPAALAIGVYWLNTRQAARQKQAEDERQARDEASQVAQAQRELAVEDQRAQDEALQTYLERMHVLLPKIVQRDEKTEDHDAQRTLARALTLTLLARLGRDRKRYVIQFLHEARLISLEGADPVISLKDANLRKANLAGIALITRDINLEKLDELLDSEDLQIAEVLSNPANLSGADLSGAQLRKADLTKVDLSGTKLANADLSEAKLSGASLIAANQSGANLAGAELAANLAGAEERAAFFAANLAGTNLECTKGFTNEQLATETLETLEGATMPNGQKYEDWLKSKGGGEEGENPRPA